MRVRALLLALLFKSDETIPLRGVGGRSSGEADVEPMPACSGLMERDRRTECWIKKRWS
jgi:hypothetical protein